MLFEDVHWADPTTRELLDLIVGQLPGMHVLLGYDVSPGLPAAMDRSCRGNFDHVEPASTGLKAHTRSCFLQTTMSPALLDQIAAQADGVPLFIEELTKAVMEGAADTASTLTSLGVPTTLQGSLLARLDRLPLAKQVAQIGSVLGREFSYELISTVADLPEPVLAKGARSARVIGIGPLPRRTSFCSLSVQACPRAGGCRHHAVADAPPAGPRSYCECPSGSIGCRTTGPGASPDRGGTNVGGSRTLVRGRAAFGRTVGGARSRQPLSARPDGADDVARKRAARSARTRFPDGVGDAAGCNERVTARSAVMSV